MLGLKIPTNPKWTEVATDNLEEILVDHAWCEQKAATNAISLIVRFSDKADLVKVLTGVVEEEWSHFRRVLEELAKRGMALSRPRKDEYAMNLLKLARTGVTAEIALMDTLLLSAIIEARSCERFRILSLEVPDPALRDFYHELMVSEAGHYATFTDMARTYFPEAEVKRRLDDLMEAEKSIIQTTQIRKDRMH